MRSTATCLPWKIVPWVFGEIPLGTRCTGIGARAAIGMAIGAQIAPPEPAAIATASMGGRSAAWYL